MRLIDLDEFLRQNCVDRMDGKSCDECKHHVLEVSCERLMEQPTIDTVKHGKSERYIKVSDIGKVCDPYRDHDVRTYTAEEIAESIRKKTPKWEELWITEDE